MEITKLQRGDTFGDLRVMNIDMGRASKKGAYYKCQCKCGVNVSVLDLHLRTGKITSHRVSSSSPCVISRASIVGEIHGDFEIMKKEKKMPNQPQRYRVRCTTCSTLYSKQACSIVGGKSLVCAHCKGKETKTKL